MKRRHPTNQFFLNLAKDATNGDADDVASQLKIADKLRESSVVIFGVPADVHKKSFLKTLSRFGRVNVLQVPIKCLDCLYESKLYDGNSAVLVVYAKRNAVGKVIRNMDGKDLNLKRVISSQNDENSKSKSNLLEKSKNFVHVRRYVSVLNKHKSNASCRLIVRNLGFNVDLESFTAHFKKFGPVVDSVLVKDKKTKKPKGFGFVQYACKEDGRKAVKHCHDSTFQKRKIQVDFAVDQNEYKRERETQVSKSNDTPAVNTTGEKKDENELNRTIFVRNLPYTSTQEDIYNLFKRYGAIRYVKTVSGSESQNKGTAFVNFYKEEPVSRVLKQASTLSENYFENRKARYDALNTAPKEADSDGIFLNGRPLFVNRAVERSVAKEYEKKSEYISGLKNKRKFDKRHLYLVEEGVIHKQNMTLAPATRKRKDFKKAASANTCFAAYNLYTSMMQSQQKLKPIEYDNALAELAKYNSNVKPAAAEDNVTFSLPKHDIQKREKDNAQRKLKIQNSLFFVSPTKISIRNMNRTSSEYLNNFVLRKTCEFASRLGFHLDVISDREGDLRLFPADWPTCKDSYKTKSVKVKSCKIFYEEKLLPSSTDRTKKIVNTNKNKGFAFIEFEEHVHALSAIRVLNNNPDFSFLASKGSGAMKLPIEQRSRLIVDFAIENSEKIFIQKKKLARNKNKDTDKIRSDKSVKQTEKRKKISVDKKSEPDVKEASPLKSNKIRKRKSPKTKLRDQNKPKRKKNSSVQRDKQKENMKSTLALKSLSTSGSSWFS